MYFVKVVGDLDADPMDRSCHDFIVYEDAKEFAERMRNKGLTCTIYRGILMDEKLEAMAELTRLDQEMGLYDVSYEDNPLVRRTKCQ